MMAQTGPTLLDNQVGLGFDHVVVETALGSRNPKDRNEDSYWPRQNAILLQPHAVIDYLIMGRLYMVADGVSGGLAGHEASELAVQTIAKQYYATLSQLAAPPNEHDIEQALKHAILKANCALLERSHERMEVEENDLERLLQSTVLCVLVRGKQATVASVGDCHLYRYRSGEVNLLSHPDHSTPHFLGSSLQHHHITLYQEPLTMQDVLILCTDGLYRYLSADNDAHQAAAEMRQIFQRDYHSNDIKQVANRLLEQANDPFFDGGRDNITVMLIECASPDGFLRKKEGAERSFEVSSQKIGVNAAQTCRVSETRQVSAKRVIIEQLQFQEQLQATWWINDRSHPFLSQLAKQAQQMAEQTQGAEQALWQRRAAQLGISVGQAEWAKAQALSYQLGFDFDENYSLVKQIWRLHNQTPNHPQLAKLAFDAVVDLANTALVSADTNKEKMLSCALELLQPLRHTLFKQIKQTAPVDAAYGEEVLFQLQEELSSPLQNLLPHASSRGNQLRVQRMLWLMMSSLLFLLALWIFFL